MQRPGESREPTVLKSKVPLRGTGMKLIDYLSQRFRYQTRDSWDRLIAADKVLVNGEPADPDRPLAHGDTVAYTVVLEEPVVDADVRIIHEEESFAVAIKPGQLPSHADGRFIRNTFIHIVSRMLEEALPLTPGPKRPGPEPAKPGPGRPSPPANKAGGGGNTVGPAHMAPLGVPARSRVMLVHRLDRETSGVMVVARNKGAHADLMRQFAAGSVDKEYLAVAKGLIEGGPFEVKGWIGRDPASTISIRHALFPEPRTGARDSVTAFEPVRLLAGATLLRCVPRTGRTNQIRVHLASIGHGVVGDKLYGRTDAEFLEFVEFVKAGGDPSFDGRVGTPRQLLHASRLAFDHPVTRMRVSFEAPMPADMAGYVEANG